MAEFKGMITVSLYGGGGSYPDGRTEELDLAELGLVTEKGDTLLMLWRSALTEHTPGSPDGWDRLVDSQAFPTDHPGQSQFFWAHQWAGDTPPSVVALHLPQYKSMVVQFIALTLAEGEAISEQWSLGAARSVSVGTPVSLTDPSADGQTFVAASFDVFAPA